MTTSQLLGEIKETNLAYLLLAQQMLREDQHAAMFRLGISQEVADLLIGLTPAQVLKMANANILLCRFRFDDKLILGLLTNHGKSSGVSQSHATILMAGQPAEALA
jgi:flagellar transcriptional activator FlhD